MTTFLRPWLWKAKRTKVILVLAFIGVIYIMATYECAKCGMAVNAFCAKCETALENDFVTSDEGKKIQVSVCPNGHGKIKSPTCCGADMDCKG